MSQDYRSEFVEVIEAIETAEITETDSSISDDFSPRVSSSSENSEIEEDPKQYSHYDLQHPYLHLLEPAPVFPPAYDTLPPGGCPRYPVSENLYSTLPQYEPLVFKCGLVSRKVEWLTPYEPCPLRSWRYAIMELNSTQLNFYVVPTTMELPLMQFQPEMKHTKDTQNKLPIINSCLTTDNDLQFYTFCQKLNLIGESKRIMRSYSLQHTRMGLAVDYIKRPNVLRLRIESEQILLHFTHVRDLIEWNMAIEVGRDVALDLNERAIPKFRTVPRRRRTTPSEPVPEPTDQTAFLEEETTRLRSNLDSKLRGKLSKLKLRFGRSRGESFLRMLEVFPVSPKKPTVIVSPLSKVALTSPDLQPQTFEETNSAESLETPDIPFGVTFPTTCSETPPVFITTCPSTPSLSYASIPALIPSSPRLISGLSSGLLSGLSSGQSSPNRISSPKPILPSTPRARPIFTTGSSTPPIASSYSATNLAVLTRRRANTTATIEDQEDNNMSDFHRSDDDQDRDDEDQEDEEDITDITDIVDMTDMIDIDDVFHYPSFTPSLKWNPGPDRTNSEKKFFKNCLRCIKPLVQEDAWVSRSIVKPSSMSPFNFAYLRNLKYTLGTDTPTSITGFGSAHGSHSTTALLNFFSSSSSTSLASMNLLATRRLDTDGYYLPDAALTKMPGHFVKEFTVGAHGLIPKVLV